MRIPRFWRSASLLFGGLALLELGSRIGLPGVNGTALATYLRSGGGSWLLTLYERVGGGGLSRGGVLAIGIMPYISARIIVWLARLAFPSVDAKSLTPEGRTSLTWWTRGLTAGLALIQSYGFAIFVQSIPGAVAHPGPGFIGQAMLVLTSGSLMAMALSEQIAGLAAEATHDLPPPTDPVQVGHGAATTTGVPANRDRVRSV